VIVADTSALVSLATAEAYDLFFDEFEVATTLTVVDELETTAEYDDESGDAARRVLDHREELGVHRGEAPDVGSDRIDEGEASCVALAKRGGAEFLITDDLRALPELRPLTDARVAISPVVLKALVERDRLASSDARERLDAMAETRSWLGAPIYRRARDLFRE